MPISTMPRPCPTVWPCTKNRFEKIDAESADNIKIFSEEALRLEKERLNAAAMAELAKNLQAAQAEADLAALLEKMDFHLKQDDIFK